MFQPTRRVFAAAGLVVFLGLGLSAPSHAASLPGLPGGAPAAIASRVWAWLEGLLVGVPSAPSTRPGKATQTTTSTTPTTEPKPTTEQGNMVDPNGLR